MNVTTRHLRHLIEQTFRSTFFSATEAKDMTEVLLYAEMSGKKTQGILKLLGNEPMQGTKPLHKPKVIKQTAVSARIDAGHNPGILAGRMATRMAVKKCKEVGVGIVGVHNSYSSTGALGYYVDEITKNNYIGLVMAGTPKAVAPYGSIDKLIGINPIAIGFPTKDDPLILDMATAAITWYGLVLAKITGKKIPSGVAIDSAGNPTDDPQKAMGGAIRTFGNNRKMSGLALMLEMFTGPLLGAIAPDSNGKWYSGSLFIAINPDLLVGKNILKKNVSDLIRRFEASRPDKKAQKMMLPGKTAQKKLRQARMSGQVDVDKAVYTDIAKLPSQPAG